VVLSTPLDHVEWQCGDPPDAIYCPDHAPDATRDWAMVIVLDGDALAQCRQMWDQGITCCICDDYLS
jgi:hypothetical protein